MSTKQHVKAQRTKTTSATARQEVPRLFRLNIEVGDLKSAVSFYTKLLGLKGRKQAGSRCYFDCGHVTLQIVDVSSASQPHPAAKSLYFAVKDLEGAYERARTLHCLSTEKVHGAPAGGIVVLYGGGKRSLFSVMMCSMFIRSSLRGSRTSAAGSSK